jgi:MFS-type transporter involved in bile tolerance (Atg22 family)
VQGYLTNKTKLILVVGAAVAFNLLLGAIAFHPQSLDNFGKSPIVIVAIAVLSIAPIYPLSRTLKQRDRFSALAIMFLICGLLTGLVYFVGSATLPGNAPWVSVVAMLSRSLILASCALFIWNGFVRKRRQ